MIGRRALLTVGLAAIALPARAGKNEPVCQGKAVESEAEAIAIARKALTAKYGVQAVAAQEPLHSPRGEPLSGRWIIVGTVTGDVIGGNFNVLLDQGSGCVLAMQIDP